jgi:hypothetical protein
MEAGLSPEPNGTDPAHPHGALLVDARNGFNELGRRAMLWTIRHRWAAGSRFAFSCYRHAAQLILRWKGRPGYTLLSSEGVTQAGRPAVDGPLRPRLGAPRQEALAGAPGGRPGVVRGRRAPEGAHVAGSRRHDPAPTPGAGTGILSRTGQEHLHMLPGRSAGVLRSYLKRSASSSQMGTATLAASSEAMLPYRSGSRPRSNSGSRASHRLPRLPSGTPKLPMLD